MLECRYVITKSWQAKWTHFLLHLQNGTSRQLETEEENLRRAFHYEGEEFIETYIKSNKQFGNLKSQNNVFDLVSAPMWYFFYYLYSDANEDLPPPCIMLAPELPNHIKEREKYR